MLILAAALSLAAALHGILLCIFQAETHTSACWHHDQTSLSVLVGSRLLCGLSYHDLCNAHVYALQQSVSLSMLFL